MKSKCSVFIAILILAYNSQKHKPEKTTNKYMLLQISGGGNRWIDFRHYLEDLRMILKLMLKE